MPRRGTVRALLHNFLGTYTSRYSEFEGYWLFGFIVAKLTKLEWNLLAPGNATGDKVIEAAQRLAVERFSDQATRAGVSGRLSRATLLLEKGAACAVPGERPGAEVVV